ncbi:MAG: ABC transporter permease subunit [Candidatus Acetothermia bacterium]|jgi:sn-glycerol 3-phosphate transport system permease protein|nr:ABC transporter permease subunit [Candidatus Acetothermia bacterium]
MSRKTLYKLGLHATLILILIAVAFPLYFAFVMGTLTHQEAYAFPPKLIPGTQFFANVTEAWHRVNLGRLMANSALVALSVAVGKSVLSVLAAFAFTHFHFRGRILLFPLSMITQMLPLPVRIVPAYGLMASFGWLNTYYALIIPYLASTTGLLLFRQFFLTVPDELSDAARVDGAGPLRYLWNVLIPLSKTNIAALFVIEFVYMWNEYLWPLIVTTAPQMRVAQIGLKMLITSERTAAEWNIIMAGTILIMLPPLVVLIVMRRQFAQGIAMQSTK